MSNPDHAAEERARLLRESGELREEDVTAADQLDDRVAEGEGLPDDDDD